ncbi:putative transcription initiation factor Rrn7, Zinc-finger [Dioscorea sansibarensis]
MWEEQVSSAPSAGGGRLSCEECGGEDFDDGDDGFYYCRLCGSQSQDLLHTATNAEDVGAPADGAVYNLFRRRAHNGPSTPVPNLPSGEDLLRVLSQQRTSASDAVRTYSFKAEKEEPSDPRDFGDAAELSKDPEAVGCSIRLRYVQGLQLMLQLQCDTLVERFNVSNSVRRIAALVWMRHLIRSGFLEGNWIRSVLSANGLHVEKKEIVRLVKGKLKVKVCNLNKKRASRIWLYSMRKAIPIYTTLAISFLACHLAKEAILPTEMTEWALDGKLPYLAAFVEIDRDLGYSWTNRLLNSRTLFRPVRTIGAWQLEVTAASIARHVGLRLPPVNFNAIASRYLKELHLPVNKIFPSACKLYEWLMPAELWLSSNIYRFPTRICVMAILIVIIRILYNIHGQGTWERIVSGLSKCATQGQVDGKSDCDNLGSVPESWKGLDDSQQLGFTPGLLSHENLSETQTSEYNAEELLAELEAGYSKICTNPDHLKDLLSYLKYCGDIIFAGITSTSTERNMIERLWEIYDNQEDEEPVYDIKEGLINLGKRSRDELPSFLSDNACDDSTDCMMGDQPVAEISGDDKGDAVERMKSSMEENGFRYLPPRGRQKTNDYLHYRRQLTDGKLVFVAHADYYVLLRSCAKVARIDPRILHLGVMKLERRLDSIEKQFSDASHNPIDDKL